MTASDPGVGLGDQITTVGEKADETELASDWGAQAPATVPGLANVFTLLSDETRLRIVFELVLRRGECPADPTLSFSQLRSRVGAGDAGRFNYHLGRLRGDIVQKVNGGYQLTPTGEAIGVTLVVGALDRLDARESDDGRLPN